MIRSATNTMDYLKLPKLQSELQFNKVTQKSIYSHILTWQPQQKFFLFKTLPTKLGSLAYKST
jgi:hypothetical protein